MSRVLPILFNTDMVRTILDGRKTVTRRAIKREKIENVLNGQARKENPDIQDEKFIHCLVDCTYQPDDIIYVRETWGKGYEDGTYIYRADDRTAELQSFKQSSELIYRPSIHMPKEAARIWLKVTDVRVERLHDISNEQILKEGCSYEVVKHYIKQMPEETEEWINAAHAVGFSQIWDSTVKKSDLDRYGWDANPWVWVIEFERCENPENLLFMKYGV